MVICGNTSPLDVRVRFRLVAQQPEERTGKQEAKKYQGEDAEYMVVFAKEYLKTHPDINFFIFGHRHIMLDLMLSRTSRILIAGDWMQFFSYIVWDGENLYMDQFLEETDGQSYPNT